MWNLCLFCTLVLLWKISIDTCCLVAMVSSIKVGIEHYCICISELDCDQCDWPEMRLLRDKEKTEWY